ncbi:hypothetical protein Q4512_15370 [Oceanihabitans sp. 2_MG-2023]|uniref:hypothetical protein n=1 Tax=Oceanihabitans sp. 2_MG-2023 TaxID=3062661 RepID=UPI0026E2A28E|nr:hypothetical protein [Oceanihabitans sp. 2_MG-2023]MDO6598303.1 hypothetical protein [Oceanihabitans sp. 2_MG-2023]
MKYFLCIIFIALFSLNSFAQELPPNPEPGKCYVKCILEDGNLSNWQTIDCEFSKLAKDKAKLNTLQIKMSNLGYDVAITGKADLKTIAAYKQYTKDEKKRLRKAKRNL